jgi:Flp pilus assembly protein TadG
VAARRQGTEARGLLTRFARDTRGNAVMIMGFALIPVIGMIGAGLDLSRTYLAKTRMQQACDAGALAGRRVLTANQFNDAVKQEATRFFNFNYRQGENATSAVVPTVTMPTNGVIHVTAGSTVPTTVMRIFGIQTLPISVQCDASQDFVNTDVVLVLDTTGSMTCTPTDAPNCSSATEKSGSKMQGLRDAVMSFYDALKPVQDQLEANGLRLRYSIVPFSSAVNVGHEIMQMNPNYMVSDTMTVQSRYAANPATDVSWIQVAQTSKDDTSVQPQNYNNISNADCQNGANQLRPAYEYNGTPTYTATGVVTTQALGKVKVETDRRVVVTWTPSSPNSATGSCSGKVVFLTTTYWRRTNWTYGPHDWDISKYVQGQAVEDQTWDNSNGDFQTVNDGATPPQEINPNKQMTWNGCVEERQTVNSITSSSSLTPPAAAYDLDINMIPTSDKATKWKPVLPASMWYQNGSNPVGWDFVNSSILNGAVGCPTEATRLRAWDDRSELLNYVNSLHAVGSTYLDAGMIWGGRMLSPMGIFGPDNPTTYNNMPVQRFVIFMTDGNTAPLGLVYSSYGVEQIQSPTRVTPNYSSDADLTTRHVRRFQIACQQVKNLTDANGNRAVAGVWAIAFGSDQSSFSTLQGCASSPDQAKSAADTPALIAAFTAIGKQIGSLRLTR